MELTVKQSIDISNYLWNGAHKPFIEKFAKTLQKKGYSWLTNEYIDSEDAEWISDYLQK